MTIQNSIARGLLLAALILPFFASSAQSFNLTSGFGGTGGQSFYLMCPPNTVLVGVRGRAGTLVDFIDPTCAETDVNGNWSSRTNNAGVAGGSGGNSFELLCPNNLVVAGMRGRSGTLVDSLRLVCQPFYNGLFQDGRGAVPDRNRTRETDAIGGTGGDPFSVTCGSQEPAVGFTGTAGQFVDRIALICNKPRKFGGTPPARVLQELDFGRAIGAGAHREDKSGECSPYMGYSYDNSSPHGLAGQYMSASMICAPLAGGRADITALGSFTLKNDWRVALFIPLLATTGVIGPSTGAPGTGRVTVKTPPVVGSNNPATTFHIWIDGPIEPRLSAKIIIEGPAGTDPYTIP
jgi:hypothetical protein